MGTENNKLPLCNRTVFKLNLDSQWTIVIKPPSLSLSVKWNSENFFWRWQKWLILALWSNIFQLCNLWTSNLVLLNFTLRTKPFSCICGIKCGSVKSTGVMSGSVLSELVIPFFQCSWRYMKGRTSHWPASPIEDVQLGYTRILYFLQRNLISFVFCIS